MCPVNSVKIPDKRVNADQPGDREELANAKHAHLRSVVTINDALHGSTILTNALFHELFKLEVVARLLIKDILYVSVKVDVFFLLIVALEGVIDASVGR